MALLSGEGGHCTAEDKQKPELQNVTSPADISVLKNVEQLGNFNGGQKSILVFSPCKLFDILQLWPDHFFTHPQ